MIGAGSGLGFGSGMIGPGSGLGIGSGIVGAGGSAGIGSISGPAAARARMAITGLAVTVDMQTSDGGTRVDDGDLPARPRAPNRVPPVARATVLRQGRARVGTPAHDEHETKEALMGEKMDQATGRAKEAAGDLTGNKDLEREGKVERASGEVKEKAGDAVDKVKDAVKKITD